MNAKHIPFLLLNLLFLFSCKEDPDPVIIQEPSTNCSTIYLRQDADHTFYENNPTYDNIENSGYTWEFSRFNKAGMDSLLFSSGIPSLETHPTLFSFLLIRNDKLVYEGYFNESNKNHSNNVHSASKNIISALIGIAINKRFIDRVDQKILDFFPAYIPDNDQKNEIRIMQLLNMTAGFDWVEDSTEYIIESNDNWIEAILDLPLAYPPGVAFNYSTGNTHLLSAILKEATGVNTCDFLYTHLMADLASVVEHWGQDPQAYFSGGYNFYITPRELAQFGLLYLNKGISGNKQIIPEDWINKSLSLQVDIEGDYDYNYCWWLTNISGYNIYKAWGYGGQYICLIPELDILIISTANTNGVYDQFDLDAYLEKYVIPAVL